jgi:hypothetical protein
MKIGDDVIISAKVIGITENNNPIIQVKSGVRMLIKESDIKSVYPYQPIPETDARRGEK